jgi:hypothetical protein
MRSAGERRRAGRQTYADGRLPPAARIRPGTPVIVCNLSRTGALVEAHLRCKPGARCEFVMAADEGELVIRARVVRCFVARLTAATVRYRTALSFEQPVITLPNLVMATGYEVPMQPPATTGVREETSRPVRRWP